MNPYQENSFFFVGVICPCGRLRVNSNTQRNYGNRTSMKSIVIDEECRMQVAGGEGDFGTGLS
jgi:hypothetical protein